MAISSSQAQIGGGCCVFLRWPSYAARYGRYRALAMDGYSSPSEEERRPSTTTRVIVGKEKRVFAVDPFVLRKQPFRFLLETVGKQEFCDREAIFVDVDAILFEHLLWLAYNDCSSLLQLNLEEIIEFYSQD